MLALTVVARRVILRGATRRRGAPARARAWRNRSNRRTRRRAHASFSNTLTPTPREREARSPGPGRQNANNATSPAGRASRTAAPSDSTSGQPHLGHCTLGGADRGGSLNRVQGAHNSPHARAKSISAPEYVCVRPGNGALLPHTTFRHRLFESCLSHDAVG